MLRCVLLCLGTKLLCNRCVRVWTTDREKLFRLCDSVYRNRCTRCSVLLPICKCDHYVQNINKRGDPREGMSGGREFPVLMKTSHTPLSLSLPPPHVCTQRGIKQIDGPVWVWWQQVWLWQKVFTLSPGDCRIHSSYPQCLWEKCIPTNSSFWGNWTTERKLYSCSLQSHSETILPIWAWSSLSLKFSFPHLFFDDSLSYSHSFSPPFYLSFSFASFLCVIG